MLAPLEGLLVDWGSLLEEVLVGIEHGQALFDAMSNVLQDQRWVVGLAVDLGRLVSLLDKGPIGASPEVKEDVEEVGRLETNSADHLEPASWKITWIFCFIFSKDLSVSLVTPNMSSR